MTPSSSMKIRLVRCPRCRRVLAELPDISLYRCGGCGTTLQAKHRKMEANHAANSVATVQQDSFQEDEEVGTSNLDFQSPPKETSSPDKDDGVYEDDGVESSSEHSEYRSAYNGLCSSPEFKHDSAECSRRHDFEIYDNKLHNQDEDSSGGGNSSGEFPISMKASERMKEHDHIYLDRFTKVDQADGEQSPKVWPGGEKIVDEVRIFYGREDRYSRLQHVDNVPREGMDDNYDKEATNLNHDLSHPPKEESFSDKESRNVSNGLLSMPDTDHCRYEDSPVEESAFQNEVNCRLGLGSKRYVRELDSDGESSPGGNFSGEIPSSSELVYQGIDELAPEAKQAGKEDVIYFDQPTQNDRCDDVEFPDHEDQENGWPAVSSQHMEGSCNYNVNLENNDVSQEEVTSSKHGFGCQLKEVFLLDKDSTSCHEERVESSTELSEDRSISNALLSSPEVKFFENMDTDESLNYDNSQDLTRSNSGLLDLGEDEDSLLDGHEKVGRFEGGESLGVCQKSENTAHKVQSISEHEAHREGITNKNVHLEHDDVSKEVAGLNKHDEGINNNQVHLESDDVSNKVARNHAHLENDDVSEEVSGGLNHDFISLPKEKLLFNKADIQFQDKPVESRMEISVVRSVSNDLSSSPQVNCCKNEELLNEESLNKDQGKNSFAPDCKKLDNGLHDIDTELTGGGNVSAEICSSTELVYHENEELISEAIEHAKECNISNLDEPTKVKPVQGENFLQVSPEVDNILHEVQNFSVHEGTTVAVVVSSAAEIVSREDGDASPIDDCFLGCPTYNRANTNEPSVGDTVVAVPVVSMGMAENLTSLDGRHVGHYPRKGSRNFGSASSMELLGDSLLSETSPERRVRLKDPASPVTRGYYAYDDSESSNDETDGQIAVYVPHSSRRKGKEVEYSSTSLKREGFAMKNMMSSEPEMEYWAPSQSNHHHAITSSHRNSDEFTETKSRILTSGNITRLNGGGSSRLPFTSRNLHANQRLRGPLPPLHPGFLSQDKTSYSEPDKMDLLRTVCELKDQLNRIQFPKISRDGRFPAGVRTETFSPSPFYYDHFIPGEERYVHSNPHRNYRPYDHGKGRVEQSNVSALSLSGEAAYYRHRPNCFCFHCRSQDRHSSAPLLPYSLNYNDRSVAPIGHNSHNVSSPLSSQNYSSYECLVPGYEITSDTRSRINNEMQRFYLRDKDHASKRHLRPVSGGSPFVTCYHCSKTLQLPADFLVFRKIYHQLRCNACSKVLKFSLVGGKHLVPYLSHTSSDVTNDRSLLAMPHSNFCRHGEPVSCSDDYGRSFCRSCSTEGESSVIVPSSGLVKRDRYNKKTSSVSSYEAMEDRKMKFTMTNSMDKVKNKNSAETFAVGTSSQQPKFVKPSSEIEELPPSPNSTLHRLMGYSSVSQVLNKGPAMSSQR